MSNTLVFLEQDASGLKKAALAGITCGQQVAGHAGGKISFLLVGAHAQQAAEKARAFGPDKIFVVENEETMHLNAEVMTQILMAAQQAAQATRVVASASGLTKDSFPRYAARAGGAMATDVIGVVGKDTYRRPMWAGNVVAEIALRAELHVLTARATDFGAPQATAGAAAVERLPITFDARVKRVKFIGRKEIKNERPDVTTAERVVSGGRGVKSADGFKQVEKLADLLGAGVGASRAVCDAGWVSNDLQIGQTGKVVAPNLYIAVGISGAIQHLAGMKGSKTIVAINQDPEAPIFQVADYGLAQDLFKAVPELLTALSS